MDRDQGRELIDALNAISANLEALTESVKWVEKHATHLRVIGESLNTLALTVRTNEYVVPALRVMTQKGEE